MALPVRLVCSVCYKVSSHKSNPTLTPESKAISDGKTKICGVCRQEWVPIRIAEEIGGQRRLVIIRPQPKNVPIAVDYQLCNNKQCSKRDQCSFAHSNVELAAWNREREKIPRAPPRLHAGQQFMLCKHMGPGKSCPYSLRCSFAHSDEELKEWNRLASENPQPLFSTTGPWARSCYKRSTSKQQLDQHIAAKHEGSYAGPPVVPPLIRPRPHNPPPPTGYRMCENGRTCSFANNCFFAHSPSELDEWNRQAGVPMGGARFHHPRGDPSPFQRPPFAAPYAASHLPLPPHAGPNFHPYPQHPQEFVEQRRPRFEPSALDEFEDVAPTQAAAVGGNERPRESETGSQTPELRDRVLTDGNATSFLETKNGVSIMELTRLGFNLKRRELAPLEWIFSISTTSPQHLKSVVLLDHLMTNYSIEGVWLLQPQGDIKFSHTNPIQGVVVSEQVTEWNIIPGENAHVKIHLNPRAGILRQVVKFDFEEFCMVQDLTVHYLGEEIKLLESIDKRPKPAKKDLYWEQRHEKVPYPLKHDEEGDMKLPDYPRPEKVEKYNNVENKIIKVERGGEYCVELSVPQAAQTKDCSAASLPSGVPQAASLPSGVAYDYDDESQEAVPGSISAPLDVMAQLKNDDSISAKVTWKMPKDMQNADPCYEVFYLSEEGIENSKEARGYECSLKNLEPDKTYTITVGILKKPIRSRSIKITTKQHFKYDDIALDMSNTIGKGASGTVYRSKLHGKDVAAKVCLQFNESELKVLSMVRHENIVEFLGFAQSRISSVYVMELAETSLHDYVHDKTKLLDYKIITQWAMHIANGVYYLHFEAMKPKHLVHCDLKSRNVLIFKGVCKICDFGSMKDIDATKTTFVSGTSPYRPPEYFTCQQYGKKAYCASDVFSYGLTLWEMLKREYPHGKKKDHELYQFYTNNEILADNDQWPLNLKSLYRSCCSYNIKERPTFKEILKLLSSGESTVTPHSTDEDM